MSTTSVILDIETLSRSQNAVIYEIGAIAFIRKDFTEFDSICIRPGIFPQILTGRHICGETIAFHRKLKTLPLSFTDTPIEEAYLTLAAFIRHHNPERIWIQGKDFDIPKLDTLFQSVGKSLPWEYHQAHCSRDAWDIAFPPGTKRDKRPHTSLGDCRATLRDLHASLKALNRLASV